MPHRLQVSALAEPPPAKRPATLPIGLLGRGGQQRFQPLDGGGQPLGQRPVERQ